MDYIFVKSQKRGFEDCGSIYAHVREPGVNRKYALGFKIKVTEWENIRQLNYSSSAFMSSIGITYGQFSTILSLIKIELEQHFDANTAANKIQEIKISILGEEKAKSLGIHYRKQTLLMQYMQEYIADLKSGKRLKRHRAVPVSQGYIDNMQATLKCLYDYQHLAHHKVTIEQVDMTFQRNFVKYSGSLPQTSKITFNKNLRKLGEIMGWTWYPHFDHQPCTKTSKKTPIRFCDMLSSHTARRSFATNSYTAGIPISSIMTVTGHSSERNFRKYLGLQAQDRAIAAAEDFKGFIKME